MIQNNVELGIWLKGKMLLVHVSIKTCDLSITNLDDKGEEYLKKIFIFQFKVQRHTISQSQLNLPTKMCWTRIKMTALLYI